jgi:putative polyketide hydroxylase
VGAPWCDAAGAVAEPFERLELDVYCVGAPSLWDTPARFGEAYGLSPSGAALVRPDGFVAWRAKAMEKDPEKALAGALGALLLK